MHEIAGVSDYYDSVYFQWQRRIGDFSAQANLFMFAPFVSPGDFVVDFGCGGGALLSRLECGRRLGVEINAAARRECAERGVDCVESLQDLQDDLADVIISSHALEHVQNPFDALVLARRKLKLEGRLVLVVPCERHDTRYSGDDINKHIYTWSPLNLGNLVTAAGFRIEAVERIHHKWPPGSEMLVRFLGWRAYHWIAWAWSYLSRRVTQLRVVATKTA
jgi:ubiquinone/menaquinone biosynthesis C-methylase UbiE